MNNTTLSYISWFARILQHPSEPNETTIILSGEEGSIKRIIIEKFAAILGERYFMHVHSVQVLYSKQQKLNHTLLCWIDAGFSTKREQTTIIKELLLYMNDRRQRGFVVPNVIMTINNEWFVPPTEFNPTIVYLNVESEWLIPQRSKTYQLLVDTLLKIPVELLAYFLYNENWHPIKFLLSLRYHYQLFIVGGKIL